MELAELMEFASGSDARVIEIYKGSCFEDVCFAGRVDDVPYKWLSHDVHDIFAKNDVLVVGIE